VIFRHRSTTRARSCPRSAIPSRSHGRPRLPSPMAAVAVDAVSERPSPPRTATSETLLATPPQLPQPALVEAGDVGFVRNDLFFRLFNILLPSTHLSHRILGLPSEYVPFSASGTTMAIAPSSFEALALHPGYVQLAPVHRQ
jgi:hypothetical protein